MPRALLYGTALAKGPPDPLNARVVSSSERGGERAPVADDRATIAMTDFGNGFYGRGMFNQTDHNNHR